MTLNSILFFCLRSSPFDFDDFACAISLKSSLDVSVNNTNLKTFREKNYF